VNAAPNRLARSWQSNESMIGKTSSINVADGEAVTSGSVTTAINPTPQEELC